MDYDAKAIELTREIFVDAVNRYHEAGHGEDSLLLLAGLVASALSSRQSKPVVEMIGEVHRIALVFREAERRFRREEH